MLMCSLTKIGNIKDLYSFMFLISNKSLGYPMRLYLDHTAKNMSYKPMYKPEI